MKVRNVDACYSEWMATDLCVSQCSLIHIMLTKCLVLEKEWWEGKERSSCGGRWRVETGAGRHGMWKERERKGEEEKKREKRCHI